MSEATVRGFTVRADLAHDLDHHMWLDVRSADRVRVGMDPLGVETAGTLAQLGFVEPGATVARGEPFGSLEAEKFVGPLVSPVSGSVLAVNEAVVADPGLVERDPYGEGWMVELAPSELEREMEALSHGSGKVVSGFERRVDQYRREGVLAE